MPFSFPQNPSVGSTSTQNGRVYQWAGAAWRLVPSGGGGSGEDVVLRAAFSPPAPTGVTATACNGQATVSWTAPAVISQLPITDYTVQSSSDSGTTWSTFSRNASTSTTATVTGLTNGTAVRFRVAAVNAAGTGSYSTASIAVTPAASSDASIANVQLLIQPNGSGGFSDFSSAARTLSLSAGAASSNAQTLFSQPSLYLANTGRVDVSANDGLVLRGASGATSWTLEFWIFAPANFSVGGNELELLRCNSNDIPQNSSYLMYKAVFPTTSNALRFVINQTGVGSNVYADASITLGQWNHVAWTRDGTTLRAYSNGALRNTDTATTNADAVAPSFWFGGSVLLNVYLSNIRITKGTARYTQSTYTVPAAAFPSS